MPHPNSPIQDPYLGRSLLHGLDLLIVGAMSLNTEVANSTHGKELTRLQRAACQIIPNGFSIALSIRELIRSGYLFSAEILVRPMIERVAVLSHLIVAGDTALDLWEQGWPHKTRPSVKAMLHSITEYDDFSDEVDVRHLTASMIDGFNAVVHADPAGLDTNIGKTIDGTLGYLSGANINDPHRCDLICGMVMTYMALLMKRAVQVFPDIKQPSDVLH